MAQTIEPALSCRMGLIAAWPRSDRPDRPTSAGDILHHATVDRKRESRQIARAGSDFGGSFRGAAGPTDHWRFLPGYEGSGQELGHLQTERPHLPAAHTSG